MFNVPTFFMLSRRNISSKHAVLTVLCIAGLRLSGIDMMPPPPSARPFSEINRKVAGAVPNGCATDLHDESEDSDHKM